jgi:hypothetical protein
VLTMQMMMTLILTPAMRVKTITDWVSGTALNEECIETVSMYKYSIYWNCQYIHVYWQHKYWVYIQRVSMKAKYSSIRYLLEYSSIGYINARYIYRAKSASMHSKYKIINSALVYRNCV